MKLHFLISVEAIAVIFCDRDPFTATVFTCIDLVDLPSTFALTARLLSVTGGAESAAAGCVDPCARVAGDDNPLTQQCVGAA